MAGIGDLIGKTGPVAPNGGPDASQSPLEGQNGIGGQMAGVGPQGAPGAPQGQTGQTVSADQAAAILGHLHKVERRYSDLLKEPGAGRVNLRPKLNELAADLLGEGGVTLPQVMNALNTFPVEPDKQVAWLKKKLADTVKAQHVVLAEQQMHNPIPPGSDIMTEMAKMTSHPHHLRNAITHYANRRR